MIGASALQGAFRVYKLILVSSFQCCPNIDKIDPHNTRKIEKHNLLKAIADSKVLLFKNKFLNYARNEELK